MKFTLFFYYFIYHPHYVVMMHECDALLDASTDDNAFACISFRSVCWLTNWSKVIHWFSHDGNQATASYISHNLLTCITSDTKFLLIKHQWNWVKSWDNKKNERDANKQQYIYAWHKILFLFKKNFIRLNIYCRIWIIFFQRLKLITERW